MTYFNIKALATEARQRITAFELLGNYREIEMAARIVKKILRESNRGYKKRVNLENGRRFMESK